MKKFNINYVLVFGWPRFFYKKIETLINNIGSFCVFKNSPIIFGDFSSSGLFDETFINGSEDVYLSFELSKKNINICYFKKYNIKNIGGSTLGVSHNRGFREIVNIIYYNFRLSACLTNVRYL